MYTLDDLISLMARLRHPEDGCPWDLQQDYRSITPSTIEEAYEVVDAIDNEAFGDLKEELGDLLFQVVFYSRLAEEEKRFDLKQVIDTLVTKLLRRHPHVFPDGTLESRRSADSETSNDALSERSIKQSWEAIKAEERKEKGKPGLLDDVPTALPAVTRAFKLQKRAAKVGFDWPEISGVVDKVKEELAELEEAIAAGNNDAFREELGDLLFTCVSLARHGKIEPEQSLRDANSKFQQRFGYIEQQLQSREVEWESASDALLDELWEAAKKQR